MKKVMKRNDMAIYWLENQNPFFLKCPWQGVHFKETTVKFIWSLHEMKCTDEMISEAVKKPVDYVQDILKKDAPQ